MKQIIFIKINQSSFINLDERLLRKHFSVITFTFKYRKGLKIISELIRQKLFLLRYIWSSDLIYIWFADFHSVIPALFGRLFGKKVVIVVGGYDAAFVPELNYGAKTRWLNGWSTSISLKLASHLLPVTSFTCQNMLKNFGKTLEKKSNIIYNCVDDIFKTNSSFVRNNKVITVCGSSSKKTVFIKGVDFYLKVAEQLPEIEFYVVGVSGEAKSYLEEFAAANIVLVERVTQEQLKKLFHESKVICQFSRFEAFGVALIEGINSGCFPVGYNFGGTSEILTNGLGILIDELSVEKGKNAIADALTKTSEDVKVIQQSVKKRFSAEVREEKLIAFIDQL
ncbi:MAG: glycosyltransferase family 4 protein [Bacteroidetes bacterium]|nr:glycosyltransferase family 4 protein [Bacteroidota bacterium]